MLSRILAIYRALLGRSIKPSSETLILEVCNDENHNFAFQSAVNLIKPYMQLHGVTAKSIQSTEAKREVRLGISVLQAVTEYAPTNWGAHFVMGKAFESLGEAQQAYGAFKRAFDIQRSNPDVAREYMLACLSLGRASEGVDAGEYATALNPSDAGLQANLALAYLIVGRHADALRMSLG